MKSAAYLFSDRGKIERALRGRCVYLFLDYDGTLAPIADTPFSVVMPERVKKVLGRLCAMPNCRIAIVSGRRIGDLKKRIRLKNIAYVGNHGLEMEGPMIRFKSPIPPRYRKALTTIKAELRRRLATIKGAIVEDKGLSLGVHYRLVAKKEIPAVKGIFHAAVLMHDAEKTIAVGTGKKALEIRPSTPWNKGKAVLWLLQNLPCRMRNKKTRALPVYIGDDTTDEDAFGSLKGKGMTICVGRSRRTKAEFFLKDTDDVARFLAMIPENIRPGAAWQKKR